MGAPSSLRVKKHNNPDASTNSTAAMAFPMMFKRRKSVHAPTDQNPSGNDMNHIELSQTADGDTLKVLKRFLFLIIVIESMMLLFGNAEMTFTHSLLTLLSIRFCELLPLILCA